MLVAPGKFEDRPGRLAVLEDLVFVRGPSAFVIAPSRSAIATMMRAALAAELRGVIADVAEALHDDALAVEAA